jgi:hypothetical protein
VYVIIDKKLKCPQHGCVKGAIHLFIENGDINNPCDTWLVCIHCARRLDSDRKYRLSRRAAFEAYQSEVAAYLEEKNDLTTNTRRNVYEAI